MYRTLMIVFTLIGLMIGALAIAQMANPCFLLGHVAMMPAEYGCPRATTWTAPIVLCEAKFQVCRRCKLVYLDERKTGSKP